MSKRKLVPSPSFEPDLENQFLRLGKEFEAEWKRVGIPVKFMRGKDPVEFRKASPDARAAALSYLDFNVAIIRDMTASGESARDTKRFLWRALQKLQLTPPSNLMEYIETEDDIVEIYLMDEIQIFRSVRFFEITSFTIEELLCRPWHRLVGRSVLPTIAMMGVILKFKLGLINKPIPWGVPEHIVWEKDTPEKVRFRMKLKYFIPLRYEGRCVGIVGVNRSDPIF